MLCVPQVEKSSRKNFRFDVISVFLEWLKGCFSLVFSPIKVLSVETLRGSRLPTGFDGALLQLMHKIWVNDICFQFFALKGACLKKRFGIISLRVPLGFVRECFRQQIRSKRTFFWPVWVSIVFLPTRVSRVEYRKRQGELSWVTVEYLNGWMFLRNFEWQKVFNDELHALHK